MGISWVTDRTFIMRCALLMGGCFNLAAAFILIFPRSLGQFANLPVSGSFFYSWMLALSIGIFGGVYLWLAFRKQIDRPLIVVAVIGKLGVFAVAFACWLLGEIQGSVLAPTVGDLSFAMVFAWWLRGEMLAQRTAGQL